VYRGKSDVCALKWSLDGKYLASGHGNCVGVWDSRKMGVGSKPLTVIKHHTSAIKALEWSPFHSSVLATGGGREDTRICLWDVKCTMKDGVQPVLRHEHVVGAQITGLIWSRTSPGELLSTHGFRDSIPRASTNKIDDKIATWKYSEQFQSVRQAEGFAPYVHAVPLERILSPTLSPNGQRLVVSMGETVQFWNVFPCSKQHNKRNKPFSSSLFDVIR